MQLPYASLMTCSPVTLGVASSRIGAFSKKLARVQCFGAMQRLPEQNNTQN